MAEHDTCKAEQKRLARDAMHLIDLERLGACSTFCGSSNRWELQEENRNEIKGDFSDWCPGKDSASPRLSH
ncbi:hypothetical protein [Methylobacterium durans]|jgi:hypothetical protein|uniref:hypothetical protein n=1 Tax=Methylobacterium durans TaxID=2202825 RepID=UPI0013A5ACCC|nr:hypothetical protein [Methylobacterium durans]